MAPAHDIRMISTPETIEMVRERVAKEGDTLIVKVTRRKHPGLQPELVASLSGATIEHVVNYERWIPQLCGGGKFLLSVYHVNDQTKQIGGYVQYDINADPKDADREALKRNDWGGPSTIDYPLPPDRRQQEVPDMYTVRPPSPPGPGTGDSATAAPHAAWVRSPGGGFTRTQYEPDNVVGFDRVQVKMGQVEAERRKVEDERLANEKEKHKAELDAIKRENAAELRSMELRLLTQFKDSKPAGPDPTATMLMEMLKQQAEDRRAAENRAAAAALEAEKQRAEDRRAAEARQAAADARFEKLIEKMSEKKPEKDPIEVFKTVAELVKKNDDGSSKAMHSMMETMGTINDVTLQFVDRMAEMQLGGREPESPIVKGAEAVAKAITGMIKGNAVRRQQTPMQPQQQLPPQAQPRPAPQQPPQDMSVLGQIEKGIRLKLDPKEIARVLIANVNDPGVQAAAMEAGGDFEAAFDKRLGNWKNESPANMAYFKTLVEEIEKAAVAAGLIAPEQPEDAQVVEPDEPEGEDEGDEAPEGDDEAP